MASNVDSRTVLDAPGAEDLIGRGDMLYQPADLPRPVRLQGVFVSDAEVHAVTEFWRDAGGAQLRPRPRSRGADEADDGEARRPVRLAGQAGDDELTPRAAQLVIETGKASTSMLQTKLKVGFNRATRLMDELEKARHHRSARPAQPGDTARRSTAQTTGFASTAEVDSLD